MKLRLNTKYFRPRLALWVSFVAVAFFVFLTYVFLKTDIGKPESTSKSSDAVFITILLVVVTTVFVLVGIAALNTYRKQFMASDKARLKRKGVWNKLTVLGDWLTR